MTFGPLTGLRVVELGHDLSAAFGTRLLADLGAEVIKIEPPGSGDPSRSEPPLVHGNRGESALFAYLNYGKRSITLNLETSTGGELLLDLLGRTDLLIWARNEEGPAASIVDIGSLDPMMRPVTVCVSAHGMSGPRSRQPSSPFVLQHAAGFAFHQASPVADPETTPPTPCADREGALAIGIVTASAALWALGAIEAGEPRPLVDVSAEDVYAYLLVEPFADWSAGAATRERRRDPSKPSMVAGGLVWLLPCADGAVMISPREDHQWARWVDVMGRPGWTNDSGLCGTRSMRAENARALGQKMSEWSIHQNAHDVFALAQAQRVACFPVSTAKDMIHNEQLIDRQFYSKLHVGSGVTLPAPGLPFQMRTSTGKTLERARNVAAPALGEANAELLRTPSVMTGERAELLDQQGIG